MGNHVRSDDGHELFILDVDVVQEAFAIGLQRCGLGLVLRSQVNDTGRQAILADGAGQADTVTGAGVQVTAGSVMESKGRWLRHRPATWGKKPVGHTPPSIREGETQTHGETRH